MTTAPVNSEVQAQAGEVLAGKEDLASQVDVLDKVVEEVNVEGDVESIKEEFGELHDVEKAVAEISLFDLRLVEQGVVEIDSSSGSDSESDTGSSETDSDSPIVPAPEVRAFGA
eukprot:101384-Amphidinium_carterae.2